MDIKEELLDELLKDYKEPDDLLGKGGIIEQLKKRLIEKALDGEMTRIIWGMKSMKKEEDEVMHAMEQPEKE